jgi:hypothetical protein
LMADIGNKSSFEGVTIYADFGHCRKNMAGFPQGTSGLARQTASARSWVGHQALSQAAVHFRETEVGYHFHLLVSTTTESGLRRPTPHIELSGRRMEQGIFLPIVFLGDPSQAMTPPSPVESVLFS